MKNLFLFSLISVVMVISGFSQVPDAFNYQSVVRNASGEIIANSNISFRISILKNSETGTLVYVETHSALTDNFGLTSLKIGKGTPASGVFNPSGWAAAPHFIRVEVDPAGGNSYIQLGTYQLLSVPYAFHAQTVAEDKVDDADADPGNEIQSLQLNGTQLSLSKGGGTVAIPSSADNWGTQTVTSDATLSGEGTTANPLKVANNTIEPSWANIQDKPGGFDDNNDDVEDGDANPNNEIQTLSVSGNDLSISDGNTVTLPASPWESSGNNIFFNSGNVGIGNNNPVFPLEVYNSIDAILKLKAGKNANIFLERGSSSDASVITFKNQGDALEKYYMGLFRNDIFSLSTGNGQHGLFLYPSGDIKLTDNLFMQQNKKIGIGIENPTYSLEMKNDEFCFQKFIVSSLGEGTFDGLMMGLNKNREALFLNYEGGPMYFGNSGQTQMTISANGNVGIGTTEPNEALQIQEGSIQVDPGYGLKLLNLNNFSEIKSRNNNLEITSFSGGHIFLSTSEFGGTSMGRLTIKNNGNIGIGTIAAEEILHVVGENPRILIEATSSNPEINFKNTGDISSSIWSIYKNGSTGDLHFYQNGNKLTLQKNTGNVGIGTTNPQGKLDVNGTIYQRGGVLHADYVFEDDYQLETIEEHANFMWKNKHLPAIPKATADENGFEIVEVGSHRKGIVEELEKAHIYISQLENAIKQQNSVIEELRVKAENTELAARIEKLEKIIVDLELSKK